MSLASLTVDLVLGLSRFEQDSGKAAQIVTRDSERMSRAAKAVNDALTKTADQAGRTQAEYFALAAAQAGLSETSQRLVTVIERTGAASALVGTGAASGFGKASEAVQAYAVKQRELQLELIASVNRVTDAYRQQRAAIVESQQRGDINTDQLKAQLRGLDARREEAIVTLKASADEQRAALATAAAEQRLADQRAADARKLVDLQNGLTGTYRQQLAALRELRDAGNLTPAQFRQAGTDLVNKQPVVKARNDDQEAAEASARASAARALALAQSGSAAATAAAQSQVYAAFLIAEAAAANQASEAATRQASVTKAIADASARSVASQQAAYATKTAFVAKITEEAQALFRTRDAQAALDAQRAGVSLQQAQQLAKFSGDRQFISTIYQAIDAEQKFADQFGKTAAEILKQDAAQRGLTNTTASAIARFEQLAAANKGSRDTAAATASNDAFTASVIRQSDVIGKSNTQLLAEDAARRGLTQQLQPYITKIAEAEKNLNKFGTTSKVTQFQLQQLHYTVSDVVASLASGISPLTILAQQGGQVRDAFGGFGNVFRAIGSLITPARVALGLLGATAGALIYAFYEGAKQSKEYADAIVLSGNAAGLTEGKYRELAKQISASGQVQVGSARAAALALAQTGEVGPQIFSSATEAVARYAAATGKTEKEVANDFASMSRGVGKWAEDHNRSLNLISAAELQQIRTLEESGRGVEAQALVYEKLNDRLRQLEPNLGTLERALRGVKGVWNQFWDAAFDIGRTETIETKIERARAAVLNVNGVGQERVSQTQLDPQRRAQQAAADSAGAGLADVAQENLRLLLRSKSAADDTAASTARLADLNKKASDADEFVRGMERRAKSTDGLKKALAEAETAFANQDKLAKNDSNYKPSSAETRASILKKIREDFTDKPAVGEADQQRKAQLDQDLKFIADQFNREKEALAFGQAQLNAQYAGGLVSLQDYYEQKRANIATGVQKELNALSDEQSRLEVELDRGAFKDPHQRIQIQTELNESVAKSAAVQRKAAQDVVLANYEQAQSLKQLAEQVNAYRASVLQSEGNDFGAAQLRQQEQLVRAKELAVKSGGAISDDDIARLAIATQRSDEFAEVQRKIAIATADASRAEDAYLLRISRGGADQLQQDTAIYQLRSTALVQLGELTEKARALADASTDPKLKQAAADLELAYAKAADAVDPALTRIREGADDLAASFRNVFDTIFDGSVTGTDALKNLQKAVLSTLTKTYLSDPLQAALKSGLQGLVTGSNPIGSFLRYGTPSAANAREGAGINVASAGYSPAKDSQDASVAFDALQGGLTSVVSATVTQTAATQTAASALITMTSAAQLAAQALSAVATSSGGSSYSGLAGIFGGGGSNPNYSNEGLNYPVALADGANNIPYDGFKATLHKNEAVVPAKYNPAAGGWGAGGRGGPDQIQIIHQGAPMKATRSETSTAPDGSTIKKIWTQSFNEDIGSGGQASSAMQSKFGLQRRNARRG